MKPFFSVRKLLFRIVLPAMLIIGGQEAGAQQRGAHNFKWQVVEAHEHGSTAPADASILRFGTNFQDWQRSNDVIRAHPELARAKGLAVRQILAYGRLKERIPDLTVTWDETNTVPIFISGTCLARVQQNMLGTRESAQATATRFFADFRDVLLIESPESEFTATAVTNDRLGMTQVRYVQQYRGIPVASKEIVLQFDPNGNAVLFTGRYVPSMGESFSMSPTVDADEAVRYAETDLSGRTTIQPLDASTMQMLSYTGPEARLVVHQEHPRSTPRLAYRIEIRPNMLERWLYTIDASSGSILLKYNASCSDGPEKATAVDLLNNTRTIDTYLHQGTYFLIDASRPMYNATASKFPSNTVGTITTLNAGNTDLQTINHFASANNTWNDASSVSAHYNASATYEYFRTTHNRNSIDDKGMTIISIVNVTSKGQSMVNAYWNGKFISYGNGGNGFGKFAAALDIAAHEMTHGVTEHTAGLEYLNQPGALNESFSDIFGAMVDRDDWLVGEDITPTNPDFPRGSARDMSDPHNGVSQGQRAWQPKHMNEFQNLGPDEDNGGVHVNSGIPNHAAYLLSTAIGRDKAERIFYRALATKLTKQSRFIDFRLAIVKSAEELYGAGGAEVNACKSACDQVGITDGNPTDKPGDTGQVNGPDKMVFLSTDISDPFYMWVVDPPGTNPNDFNSLSATSYTRRPAVADDGSMVMFVDGDKNVRALQINPAAPNEQVIDNSGVWGSIAMSRDKRLVALTTTAREPKIHVFDMSGPAPVLKTFEVSTPSYTDDPVPNVAKFVDAMDFSHDGTSILFDTYNVVSLAGDSIDFWDINLINVWDTSTKQFAAGRILRIFPQEPLVSIGNPSWSKNKPTVFAFDLQIPDQQESFIVGTEIISGEVKQIAQVAFPVLGFPSYRGDDKMISFASMAQSGQSTIYNVTLADDAMTPQSQPAPFIVSADLPVWFRVGKRVVSVDQPSAAPVSSRITSTYPNPSSDRTVIGFSLDHPASVSLTVYDMMGRLVRELVDTRQDAGTYTVGWNGDDDGGTPVPAGLYLCRLVSDGTISTRIIHVIR